MRLLGMFLLIAVLAVGFFVMRALIAVSPGPQPVASAPQRASSDEAVDELAQQIEELERQLEEETRSQPVAPPAEPADAVAPPVSEEQPPVRAEDCFAPKHDYNTSVPSTLSVAPGHLLVASFFEPGGQEQVTVLTPGTWSNSAGWTFGVTFDYPACPQERVISEAQGHASRRGGVFLGVDQGFSRS